MGATHRVRRVCDLCTFNQCVLMFFRYDLHIFSRLRRSEGGTLQQGVLLHLARGGGTIIWGVLLYAKLWYRFILLLLGAVARVDGSPGAGALAPMRGLWTSAWISQALTKLDESGLFAQSFSS